MSGFIFSSDKILNHEDHIDYSYRHLSCSACVRVHDHYFTHNSVSDVTTGIP